MTSSDARSMGWKRADHIAWVGGDEHVVVLNLDRPLSGPLALDGTGAGIWDVLDATPRPLGYIVVELARRYGVEPEAIQADVNAFLELLRNDGLAMHLHLES